MNLPFEGSYTPDRLIRLDRASRKALGSSGIYTNAGCFGAAALVLLILGIIQWSRGNQSGAFEWFVLFLIAAMLAPMQWWSTRRSYARHPHANQRVSGVLLDDGFEIRTPTSESKVAWDGIASSFCAPDYLVLLSRTEGVYGFSADFFRTPDEFTSACEFVRSRVPGKPPGRSPRKHLFRVLGWIVLAVVVFLVWSLMRPAS